MNAAVQIVGFIASAISLGVWWPQAVIVWKGRHDANALTGVSAWTQGLQVANAGLWIVYAILTHAYWVGAPGLVNAPLAVLTIIILRRARLASVNLAEIDGADFGCPTCPWDTDAPHVILITAAPGFGSRMPCSPETARHGHPVAADVKVQPSPTARRVHQQPTGWADRSDARLAEMRARSVASR